MSMPLSGCGWGGWLTAPCGRLIAAFTLCVAAALQPAQADARPVVKIAATAVEKLTARDGDAYDLFGRGLAVSGNTLVIASPYDAWEQRGTVHADQGSVVIYARASADETWTRLLRLSAEDGAAYDFFGSSLALQNDRLVVGTDGHGVYVFERDAGGPDLWGQVQYLASPAEGSSDFGWSVALDGDWLAIGDGFESTEGGYSVGAVYVYHHDGLSWQLVQRIGSPNDSAYDYFGVQVALAGGTLAVTAPPWAAASSARAVYLFEADDAGLWSPTATLTDASSETFPESIALSPDTLAVGAGASGDDGVESVAIYRRKNNKPWKWTLADRIERGQAEAADAFGSGLVLAGDMLVLGACWEDVDGSEDQGRVYVYRREPGTTAPWTLSSRLNTPDEAAGAELGCANAIDGETVLSGAAGDTINGNVEQGSVYRFDFP